MQRVVLAAAMNGPLTDLVIPPLPLALLEVQKRLKDCRPLQPSDINAPFDQASSSPWAVWMADEHDSNIPSHIDLGDPNSFWWKNLQLVGDHTSTTRKATPTHIPSNDEETRRDELPTSEHGCDDHFGECFVQLPIQKWLQ